MNTNSSSKSLNENHCDYVDDDDGFILVKSKRKSNNHNSASNNKFNNSNLQKKTQQLKYKDDLVVDDDHKVVDKEYVFNLNKKILEYKQRLRDYDTYFYWSKMQISLRKILNEYFVSSSSCSSSSSTPTTNNNNINDHKHNNKKINLICYGLGSIDNNICSRYQLALFLLIIDEINKFSIMNCSNEKINNNDAAVAAATTDNDEQNNRKLKIDLVEFYDPVFNQTDKSLLTDCFHFKLATTNEKCLKCINSSDNDDNDDETMLNIFYMPHCGKAMYNNLLYSNWSKQSLSRLCILGNSFNTITTNNLDNKLNKYYTYIKDSLNLINEIKLGSDCDLTNAFTDFSFHTFDRSLLNNQSVLSQLVNKLENSDVRTAPIYEPDSEELF